MRFGVLTGGGDCPGLNAVIRAIVRKGIDVHGDTLIGFRDGWRGVLENDAEELTIESTRGILPRGGTILGTSRTNPFKLDDGPAFVRETFARPRARRPDRDRGRGHAGRGEPPPRRRNPRARGSRRRSTTTSTAPTSRSGSTPRCRSQPRRSTAFTSTAESHHRILVVEVMGRHAGWIALQSGVAGGADVILIPERPFDIDEVCALLERRRARGRRFSIVVAAEGALPTEGEAALATGETDEFGHPRLGGVGHWLEGEIESRTGFETRTTVLGHVQRGGTPTPRDRVLATRFGLAAIDAAHDGPLGDDARRFEARRSSWWRSPTPSPSFAPCRSEDYEEFSALFG